MKVGAIILAAGFSSRMKNEKSHLLYANGTSFAKHLIQEYQKSKIQQINVIWRKHEIGEPLISIQEKDPFLSFIYNSSPEKGRNYSIQLGLQSLKHFDYIFIQNIDNPFTTTELINKMLEYAKEDAAVIPNYKNSNGHPVLLPKKQFQKIISTELAQIDFKQIIWKKDPILFPWNNKNILANINTKDDYKKWFNNSNPQ